MFTAKEIKNGVFGSWCSSATSLGLFEQISTEQLVVGHTHEDIGSSAAVFCFVSHSFFGFVPVSHGLAFL